MVCGLSWAKLGPEGHKGRALPSFFFVGGKRQVRQAPGHPRNVGRSHTAVGVWAETRMLERRLLHLILCAFLVLVPAACISATATMGARSTHWWHSRTSSKKLPVLSLGILRLSVPTHVSRPRSLSFPRTCVCGYSRY